MKCAARPQGNWARRSAVSAWAFPTVTAGRRGPFAIREARSRFLGIMVNDPVKHTGLLWVKLLG